MLCAGSYWPAASSIYPRYVSVCIAFEVHTTHGFVLPCSNSRSLHATSRVVVCHHSDLVCFPPRRSPEARARNGLADSGRRGSKGLKLRIAKQLPPLPTPTGQAPVQASPLYSPQVGIHWCGLHCQSGDSDVPMSISSGRHVIP